MRYGNIVSGRFISRHNRFIAQVEIDGNVCTVHVKNTGRCRELLTEGARVILEQFPNGAARKTMYDLVAVYKGDMLINMDSQSPNKAVKEFLPRLFGDDCIIRPEKTYRNSRFDFYIESGERRIFMEVKGCTLESGGICRFPDAPTERGLRHINELVEAVADGYEAYIFFVIQMNRARYFTPNAETHPEFAAALKKAAECGVRVIAYTCNVREDSMDIAAPLEVRL